MRQTIFLILILLSIIMNACVIVETANFEEEFDIKILSGNKDDTFELGFYNLGTLEVCPKSSEEIFFVKFPKMRGGYSKFLFLFTYNKHDPYEYKALNLIKDGKVIKDFSIRDVEKLEKDASNIYYLKVDKRTEPANK